MITIGKRYVRYPGADQIQQWKNAIARHNAAKRNRRGRRPPKPITGIVINPPGGNMKPPPKDAA